MNTSGVGDVPAPPIDVAWRRLHRQLERADTFWFGVILTPRRDAAAALAERAQGNRESKNAPFVLLRPKSPAELAGLLDQIDDGGPSPPGCIWIEALPHLGKIAAGLDLKWSMWHEAWTTFLQSLNHRRDTLRSRLGGLVLVGPPAVKTIAMRVSTDLWSVLAYLAEIDDTLSSHSVSTLLWIDGVPPEIIREITLLLGEDVDTSRNGPRSTRLQELVGWALESGRPGTAAVLLARLATLDKKADDYPSAIGRLQEAVDLHRQLTAAGVDTFQTEFARSLAGLGRAFSVVGRAGDAVPLFEEAVGFYRGLVGVVPGRYEGELAGSLAGLGRAFSVVGRAGDAVPLFEEAVRFYRGLTST
jgi:tetratricopeptide (TPR) repeat protein